MNNDKDNTESQGESISGEACTIINTVEIQSINLRGTFSKESFKEGWRITVQQNCAVTINYKSALGKTDIALGEDDQIEKDGDNIFLIRKQPLDSYKDTKTSSPLAMDLDRIRNSSSPVSDVERKSPVPSPPQRRE